MKALKNVLCQRDRDPGPREDIQTSGATVLVATHMYDASTATGPGPSFALTWHQHNTEYASSLHCITMFDSFAIGVPRFILQRKESEY
jgi:hypothetical protein